MSCSRRSNNENVEGIFVVEQRMAAASTNVTTLVAGSGCPFARTASFLFDASYGADSSLGELVRNVTDVETASSVILWAVTLGSGLAFSACVAIAGAVAFRYYKRTV